MDNRILVINNIYPPQELGGYGRYISDFANILRSRGHSVQVLTSDAPYLEVINTREEYVDRTLTLYGSYAEIPPKAVEDDAEINKIIQNNDQLIREKINSYNPDVCLIGNIDMLSSSIFKPFLDNYIPIIHHVAFNQPGYPVDLTPQHNLYHLSACSNFVKNNIIKLGFPLEDISVIYPGAYVDQFKMPILPNIDKLRIVFASIVMPYKGPQTLIEALAILQDLDIDFHCSIAGTAPQAEFIQQLQNFVMAKGMSKKVDFLGYIPRTQLIDLYAKSNVFVFPSVWDEPFGISQVEGMAAALTVITSATGGASEIVENKISGLTFQGGNAQALATNLVSLVNSPQLWHSLCANGEKRARAVFDIYKSVDLLEAKFAELLLKKSQDQQFLAKAQLQIQTELQQSLSLKQVNLIIFPDWSISEEELAVELSQVIQAIAARPDARNTTLLIDSTGITFEDANLFVSGIVMNIMLEENIDLESEGSEIAILPPLNPQQWSVLTPMLNSHIILNHENPQAAKPSIPKSNIL